MRGRGKNSIFAPFFEAAVAQMCVMPHIALNVRNMNNVHVQGFATVYRQWFSKEMSRRTRP